MSRKLPERTAASFGFEWAKFSDVFAEYEANFMSYVSVDREFFRGKTVLDAGCGAGRHAWFAHQFGAREVLAFDFSTGAVEAASANLRGLAGVSVHQADIYQPRKEWAGAFDYVMCTTEDAIISGDYLPIKDTRVGMPTFGVDGLGAVINKFERRYSGPIYNISASGMLPFNLTPEHPVLVVTGEVFHRTGETAKREFGKPYWKNPKDLRYGQERSVGNFHSKSRDYLVIPRLKGEFDCASMSLSGFVTSKRSKSLLRHRGRAFSLSLDADIMWLLGLYVAEGFSSKGHVAFGLHAEEWGIMHKIESICTRLGYSYRCINSKINKGATVSFCSVLLSRAFCKWFGVGASNKRIPDFVLLHSREDWVRAFLAGYEDGDGCYTNETMSIGTVSKVLALQLQIMYARLGTYAKIYPCKQHSTVIRGRQILGGRPIYGVLYYPDGRESRYHVTDGYIYAQIRDVQKIPFDGTVHNIATTDSTYLIGNATVHNCIGVLHHLPNPEAGFRKLVQLVKPGGIISIWVYGNRDNWMAKNIFEPLRLITTRIPHGALYKMSWAAALAVELCNRARLPLFRYYSRFPFRTKWNDAFDVLSAPQSRYYDASDIQGWYEGAGLQEVEISHRMLCGKAKGIRGRGVR